MSPKKAAKVRKRRNERPYVIIYPTLHPGGMVTQEAHLYIHPNSQAKDVNALVRDYHGKTLYIHVTEEGCYCD